jgi:hypothetical protein
VPGAGPAPAPGEPLVPAGRAEPTLTAHLKPRRNRRPPYRFKVSGRVRPPAGLVPGQACGSGTVAVRGKRARLKPDCTFAIRLRVRRRGPFGVTARFAGNRALLAATAEPRRARAG